MEKFVILYYGPYGHLVHTSEALDHHPTAGEIASNAPPEIKPMISYGRVEKRTYL